MKIFFNATALIVLSNSVFAATTPTAPITCPKEIVCSMDKRVSSCKPVTDHPEYWDKIRDDSPVTKGVHGLKQIYTSYQSRNYNGASCFYEGMALSSKYTTLLEALPGESTAWQIDGYYASCYSDNVESCPLSLVPVLNVKVNMIGYDDSVNVTANGIDVLDYPIYSDSSSGGIINLYQAWNACYDDKTCQLDFVANDDKGAINIGSVIVDMQNKMQILKIKDVPASKYELSQGKDSNSLVISAKK